MTQINYKISSMAVQYFHESLYYDTELFESLKKNRKFHIKMHYINYEIS